MTSHQCAQCGAIYELASDSCAERFNALLALDHSRQEPWGSRHGSAFAAYTLQHPRDIGRESLERCWLLLYRIWIAGDDAQFVAPTLREMDRGERPTWKTPPLPSKPSGVPRVTIADLGAFDADVYPALLESWCRATLESLGQPPIAA